MGNSSQSQQSKSNNNVIDNYLFLKPVAQGRSVYRHKATGKEYLSLERTFPTSEALLEYEQKMKKLLNVKHPYFLNETEHAMITSSTLCSMQYRVIHYFEHEPHTLQQELETRKKHQKPFQQKEIWSILCGAVLSLSYLTKEDILCYTLHPKNIIIDKLGMIKILSPLLTDNGMQIMDEGFYYSPQHMKAFKTSSNFNTVTNKSSVFTLGITLLHILSLEQMSELYDYENYTINMQRLAQIVDKLTQKEIKSVLRKMLKFHTYERITFTELEEMLFDILESNNSNQVRENKLQDQYNHDVNDDATTQRFSTSIQRAYQSPQQHQNDTQQWNSMQVRSYQPMNLSGNQLNQNKLQSKWPDIQDHSNLFILDSDIDYPNVDEKDSFENQQNNDRLESSKLFQNNSSILKNSNLLSNPVNFGTAITALQEISNRNMTHFNMTQIQKQKHSFLKAQSKGQQNNFDIEQTSRPVHVRQELSIGIYEGYKLNSYRHGYGVFHYTQGGKYAGEWFKNKMQGRGALYYANEHIAYEGEWLNDQLHGFGILYNEIPTYIIIPFDFKSLHLIDNCWTKYEGNFYQDEKNGEGTLFLSNGEYFRGFFKEGLPHGKGVFKTLKGDIVKGCWILGVMQ